MNLSFKFSSPFANTFSVSGKLTQTIAKKIQLKNEDTFDKLF